MERQWKCVHSKTQKKTAMQIGNTSKNENRKKKYHETNENKSNIDVDESSSKQSVTGSK